MAVIEKVPKRAKQHTVYQLANGSRVPGVTTILGVLNKPALVKWANNLGLQGIDSSKYVDDKAAIGSLAHAMIEAYLSGEKCDTSEYSQAQISQAETCLIKFWDWEKEHRIVPILCETPMVSEEWKFGGTIDCIAEVDGKDTLLDFKTSKGIFPEMLTQLSAYQHLSEVNGYSVHHARIIRIGRNEDEGFEDRAINNLSKQWDLFTHCLAIYQLQNEIKRGK